MKVIFIMSDSYRRDHIGAYGNKWIHTPNLDRLAAMSNVFDQCYIGSFPTGPNRRDILVGAGYKPRHAFNPWINIADNEVPLPARLTNLGIHTSMVTDVANGVTRGRNMFKGFEYYVVNRGQEGDGYAADYTVSAEMPVPHEVIRYNPGTYRRVIENRAHRRYEEDYFAPGTYKMACEWLERNYKRPNFLLWIETFDPHEPWDPPPWYVDRYDRGYPGRVIEFPPYGYYRRLGITEREMKHTQARYAGECTMVDHCIGRLLATLDKLQLLDDVAIVFTSDHGICAGHVGDAGCSGKPHFVGEEGAWLVAGKPPQGKTSWFPLRTGISRIPLLIKLPGQAKGRRFSRIAQPWDIAPTILDLFGLKVPPVLQGRSLLPLMSGRKLSPRPYAFNGAIQGKTNLRQATNAEWIYSCWPTGEREPSLIHLKTNPEQDKNVASKHPDICRQMHAALAAFDPGAFE
jgi:arylsulfatase A-like enzyme